ncbi:histidine kinase [Saccharopolyspora sp. NPDC047091]|uniref:sensor histidine kinase n=1 Tax=Saccharopolyspora sp. NPDC047091 TaxID=3155924 RepID=UPI0033CFECF2
MARAAGRAGTSPARLVAGVVVRLAALAVIACGSVTFGPGLGGTGRQLVALVCTAAACAGWLGWTATSHSPSAGAAVPAGGAARKVLWTSVSLLSVSGSVLAGVSPASPAFALGATGIFAAALVLEAVPAVGLLVVSVAGMAIGTAVFGHSWPLFAAYGAANAGLLLGGFNHGQHRARLAQAEELAAQTRRAQEEHRLAGVLAERTRIAREIHDVLAHSLGALAVQLDATDAVLEAEDASARSRENLRRAHRLAVDGLAETRRAIGALRGESSPLPDQLQALVAQHREHAAAHLAVTGVVRALSSDVVLAVVRTAQEALTNATKHAPGSRSDLAFAFGQDRIVFTATTSAGPATGSGVLAGTGGGYGLTGLTERAALLGGELDAGPAPGGGWVVRLVLPAAGEAGT